MARQKGYALGVMCMKDGEYNNQYSIRVTSHGRQQMEKRGISGDRIVKAIQGLSRERILKLQRDGRDVCAVDKNSGISVVFGFSRNRIMVVTFVDECENIFSKNKTLKTYV